ncbi:hypothetical protein K5549_020856, partial [Capra hircus]
KLMLSTSLGVCVLGPQGLFSPNSPSLYPHSLSYNFTISPWPRHGQPWCEVQGEVDQKIFLSYDCGTAKIKYMSPLGEEVKNMSAWETQTHTLRDTGDLLQEHGPDVTPEKHTDKGPLTLQARMTCWHEDNGHTSAFWEFGFNGQLCFLFDSENGHCTMVHPGGRQMKEKWENDRAVTDFFKNVSMGDCRAWLQAFLVRWEKLLNTLASLTTGPSTVQPMATASNHFTWITTGVLTSFVIMGIIIASRPLSFLQETVLPGSPNVCSVGLRTQSLLGRLCSPAFTLEPGDETQEFGACLPVMMTRWLHYLVSLITSGEKPPESLFFSQPILPLSLAAK